MKVIVVGATGNLGNEVLQKCLKTPSITSIVALVRRPLPEAVGKDPKIKTVILKDFSVYPEDVLRELVGSEVCYWCIGSTFGDAATNTKVNLEYPLAAADAFAEHLAPHTGGKLFRFVYLSGGLGETDQNKTLFFMAHGRRLRGQTETELLKRNNKVENFEAYVIKPAGVLKNGLLIALMGNKMAIHSDEFALSMIDIGLNGFTDKVVLNPALVEKGRELLKASK